jgi:dihydroorotate dehydrogenase
MYKIFIRPLLFTISPEKVHHLIVRIIKISFLFPGVRFLVRCLFTFRNKALETSFAGLTFKNPVGLAAGFDKNAEFYDEFSAFGFGFIEIGTVTPYSQPGNEKPRSFRLAKDKALINRMGFNNVGADKVKTNLSKKETNILLGGNIGKNTATSNEHALVDYEYAFRKIYDQVDYIVVNVSCPNINDLRKLHNQESLTVILNRLIWLRNENQVSKPILLKISPDLNWKQIDETIDIVNNIGLDGLIVTNTTVARDGLKTSPETIEKIGEGGLSGKPLTRRSTEIISYIHKKTNGAIPIIGVGGIMSASDAIDKIKAGATLIQIYTGFIYQGPMLAKRINKAILRYRKKAAR